MTDDRPATTRWQRAARRRIAGHAGKDVDDALTPEDWAAYFEFSAQPSSRAVKRIFRALPSSPRCGYCGAPFAGFGAKLVRPLGYRPSEKNPNICSTCVEVSPPGGVTLEIGVLFADLRGFTTLSERAGSTAARHALHRFYATAEDVLFPEALIDKVIGDAVLALYLPHVITATGGSRDPAPPERVAQLMIGHARELLARMRETAPDVGVGVGMAFGEAFFGHVGDGSVHDFTAIGDVVNTASRLQAQAAPGEVVLAANLGALIPEPVGEVELLTLKGKDVPVAAHRLHV